MPKWVQAQEYQSHLWVLLTISVPPIFDMGHNLKEFKDYLFYFGKLLDRKITL